MITETKLDDSFSVMLFNIEGGYYTFRLNQNEYGGGILLYVREDITIIQIDSNQELYH